MYYHYEEVLYSELPVYLEKENNMYFFNELEKEKAFIKIGFLLVSKDPALYKPVYKYNL